MAIPDFQSLMLPLLKIASDGQEHGISECHDALIEQFGLSEEEVRELLPSGRQTRFRNRIGWALTHLKKAGLLEGIGRGKFRITQRGLETLKENPSHVDVKYLERFPEFREFRGSEENNGSGKEPPIEEPLPPEERLELVYRELTRELAQELLERVKGCSPEFFERLVLELLVRMGYGGSVRDAAQRIGRTGDGGIDGVIKEDILGLDVLCIQAKRWQGSVGVSVVREFAGSLLERKARKGVLITTSSFTVDAREYAKGIGNIVLIDGEKLAELMIEYGVGV
ncbi:restriction endonuclease [Desulfofundulus thermosubterraneus]|uniref:Restriction system protein n=1 Tax=Desulfofundulus thermosubterraneus DSM 16057 TaxID=1121432 RepID=A0A1M6GX87_9FIRM|nr:restriction endonuclease [Desulfofundulus thermosubterraneus]SHJ14569.1 restriction system protein [Desulfofundulus thermosubterraneus DSM 16057]